MIYPNAQHTSNESDKFLRNEWLERAAPLAQHFLPALMDAVDRLHPQYIEVWQGDTLGASHARHGYDPEVAFRLIDTQCSTRMSAEYRVSVAFLPGGLKFHRFPFHQWEKVEDFSWSLSTKILSDSVSREIIARALAELASTPRGAVIVDRPQAVRLN